MWRRSTFCNGADACVEVAYRRSCSAGEACVEVGLCPHSGEVLVRDSKLADASPVLRFDATDWAVFVSALAAEQLGTYGGPVLLVAASLNCWEMWRDGAPWLSLTFDDAEVDAFVAGVMAGEFTPEALSRSDVDALAKRCVGPEAAQESSPVSR